jgi:hypothetical protein
MSVRFRIRTSQGQEISFASHEMFAEFVRSGDLSPDDVVYDAETREWSSARTHPVVLQIELESEEEAEVERSEEPDEAVEEMADLAPSTDSGVGAADIGLDLAPAPDEMSPEQEAAEFVKKMEAERASSRQFDEDPSFGFTMEHGSSGLLDSMTPVPEPEEPKPARPAPPPPPRRPAARREEPRRQEAWRDEPREAPSRKSSKAEARASKKKAGSGSGPRYAAIVVVAAAVVAGGVYFGPQLFQAVEDGAVSTGQDSVVLPPPPPPLIPDTEEALRERAQERYLTTTRALLRDLPPIPDIWLRGAYLAAPSDYPLAAAMADFQGAVGPRAAHYDRVEALAMAAIQGHDALVQAEGTIAYEPAATTPVSGDPVIEAVGRNPKAQELLDEVLDVILAQLQAPDGAGRSANVGEWVWSGLLDAVAN